MLPCRLPTGSLVFDHLVCHIWENSSLYYMSMFCSTYCTIAAAIERYMKIVHPLWYATSATDKIILRLIISAWLVGSAIAIPGIFFVTVQNGRCCLAEISFVSLAVLSVLDICLVYAAPVLILLYCYCRIAYKLFAMRKPAAIYSDHNDAKATAFHTETTTGSDSSSNVTANESVSSSSRTAADTHNNVTEPRATNTEGGGTSRTVITEPAGGSESRNINIEKAYFTTVRVGMLVAIIYFVCWTADQVRVIWGYMDVNYERQLFGSVALFLVNLNCVLNPLSYIFSFTELRARLLARFSKCLPFKC